MNQSSETAPFYQGRIPTTGADSANILSKKVSEENVKQMTKVNDVIN